jgi:tetratricopeptide (TPR) repeat protein
MSVAAVHCGDCKVECDFDGMGPFPPNQETSYGVAWKCTRCGKRSMDVCSLGPLAPTALACLNCGASRESATASCVDCGLSAAQTEEFLRINEAGPITLQGARDAIGRRLYRRGLAMLNRLLQQDVKLVDAWDFKIQFLGALSFRRSRQRLVEDALALGAPAVLLIPYASLLAGEGAHQEAVAAFQAYLERSPETGRLPSVYSDQARSLTALGEFALAERAHQRAIALAPDYASLYLNYGDTLIRQGKWDAAIEALDRGLGLTREQGMKVHLLDAKAFVFAGQHRGADALACVEQSLALGSDLPRTHYLHGRALALLGRLDEAKTAMREVLKRDPGNADAVKAITTIDGAMQSSG